MLAVIKTGGKQYKVEKGDKIRIEKVNQEEGDVISFNEVLFLGDAKISSVGSPFLEGKSVEGKVLTQGRHKKVWGMKHKAKKRYKLKFGHRQSFTEVEITKLG